LSVIVWDANTFSTQDCDDVNFTSNPDSDGIAFIWSKDLRPCKTINYRKWY
jgi:hypothetical protein